MHKIKTIVTMLLLTVGCCGILSAAPVAGGKDIYKAVKNADNTVTFVYDWDSDAVVYEMNLIKGHYSAGFKALVLSFSDRSKGEVKLDSAYSITDINPAVVPSAVIKKGTPLFTVSQSMISHNSMAATGEVERLGTFKHLFTGLWQSTGIYDIYSQTTSHFAKTWHLGIGKLLMIFVGILLIGLAIFKGFEPLLLLPIGFGAILSNIPLAGIAGPEGILGMTYYVGIATGIFPLIIFLGVGAMTFPAATDSATDLALLLADYHGAQIIVNAGSPFDLDAVFANDPAATPTAMLTRSKLGARLVDASAISDLYTVNSGRGTAWLWAVLGILVAAAAIVLIVGLSGSGTFSDNLIDTWNSIALTFQGWFK